jgi:DHA3 family macrolide efflux protein-like MFS transporter
VSKTHLEPRTVGFLFVGGLAVAGTIVGHLGATSATTYASAGNGGVTTGIFLAIMLFAAGIAALWTNQMAAKWGGEKVFTLAQVGVAASWTFVGVLEVVTDSSLVVLFAAAPIFGISSGISGVLTPIITRSYVDTGSLTASLARRSAVSGIAAMLGAVIGGYLILATDPGVGIVANGLLTLPLVIFLISIRPVVALKPIRAHSRPTHDIFSRLRNNPQLQRVAVVAVAMPLLVIPVITMIVPILNDLDHAPLPSGAGLMLAGVAAGRLLVPYLTKRLLKHRQELASALWAAIWASGFMIILAASVLFPLSDFDLVVWTIIGFGLGASRFTVRPLATAAAAKSGAESDEIMNIVVVMTIGIFCSPVGVLLWGFMIEYIGAPSTVAISAVAMIAVVLVLAGQSRPARR